jgi:hypothetical protein
MGNKLKLVFKVLTREEKGGGEKDYHIEVIYFVEEFI